MACMSIDTAGPEILAEADCMALIRGVPVGRVVFSDRALPVVVPVNFAVDGHDVVIRTARRSRLAVGTPGNVVAFEVDEIDAATRSGWSVVLTGRVDLVEDSAETARLDELGLRTWTTAVVDVYVRLRPTIITGRRLQPAC
jgi:nitroimidazol reductase NimA-like FMN-containing flavoprotein (pyridoxamine 5'-phosphate oxidase superfamily)